MEKEGGVRIEEGEGKGREMRNGYMCVHVHKGVMPTEAKTVSGQGSLYSSLNVQCLSLPSTLPVLTCAFSPSITLCHVVQDIFHSAAVGEGARSVLSTCSLLSLLPLTLVCV